MKNRKLVHQLLFEILVTEDAGYSVIAVGAKALVRSTEIIKCHVML